MQNYFPIILASLVFSFTGCVKELPEIVSPDSPPTGTKPESSKAAVAKPATPLTPDTFHARIKAKNPKYNGKGVFQPESEGGPIVAVQLTETGVSDLSPLAGLKLFALYIEKTHVTDLSPIRGMPIRELYLSDTIVKDLSPLKGMPLQVLNLLRTRVHDLEPLAKMPLRTLWLNDTKVSSIEPLRGVPLESLTLKGTKVADLGPLEHMPTLQRLHIAESSVTDLTPLRFVNLNRLVFTPSNITAGLDYARQMPTLRHIGTKFDEHEQNPMPSVQFWELFDKGEIE